MSKYNLASQGRFKAHVSIAHIYSSIYNIAFVLACFCELVTVLLTKSYMGDQIMGDLWPVRGKEKYIQGFWWENLKETDYTDGLR